MTTPPEPTAQQDLTWLLGDLASRTTGVRAAALASMDGIPRAAHALDPTDAQYLSARACAMFSIASGICPGVQGPARQVVIELDGALMFIVAAGENTVLALTTDADADAGIIGHEMSRLVSQVQQHLATPIRAVTQGTPG